MGSKQKQSHEAFVGEFQKLEEAYASIGARMPKELDHKSFSAAAAGYSESMDKVKKLEAALKKAREERADRYKAGKSYVKRVRKAVAAVFGEDSVEYATVGGTRTSARKRPVRKPKLAPVLPVKSRKTDEKATEVVQDMQERKVA